MWNIFIRTAILVSMLLAAMAITGIPSARAANGSVSYTYDSLGRVASASYDTGVIVYYAYDANGNRTQQVVNVNTLPLCFGTTKWGAGLWAASTSC